MTAADAGQWMSECVGCGARFCDGPDIAGVCPHCGHENNASD